MKFILTAGGHGTKLWPYSREDSPKQFQKIIHGQSLFSYNVNVLLDKYKPDDIFISTKRKYVKIAHEQAPKIPLKNYIIEPDAHRGRGPAEGLAFVYLSIKYPNEPFMIIQVDDLRIPEDNYLDTIEAVKNFVQKNKTPVTGGIMPKYPVLGVDYLRLGKKVKTGKNIQICNINEFIWRVNEYSKTKKLIKNNKAVIHCNHLCWYPDLILNEYKKYRKDWYEALMKIKKILSLGKGFDDIVEIYQSMLSGSTEEVTSKILTDGQAVVLNFTWIDIGTWDSVYEYFSQKNMVYADGNVIALDSKSSLIKSDNPEKLIAVFGLKNMVVVDTNDILLIVPKDKTDKIAQIQEEIKNKKLEKYL